MKRSSTIVLQIVIVLVAVGAATFLLWEPTVEGVNAHATWSQVYFDPFVLFVYVASIAFFAALYQAYKALGYAVESNTSRVLKSLHIIKLCAFAMIGFVIVGEIILRLSASDDRAGGVFMGVLITLVSIGIAAIAGSFEKRLQSLR